MSESPQHVIMIGAMKSGTTTLWHHLRHHPQVCHCKIDEVCFFVDPAVYEKGFDWYMSLFDYDPQQHRILLERSGNDTKVPRVRSAAPWIARHIESPKLIYLVRDPVERIESQYNYSRFHGWLKPDSHPTDESHIAVSRYAMQIEPFEKQFGRDAILIVNFERLVHEKESVLREVEDFLGLDHMASPEKDHDRNASKQLTLADVVKRGAWTQPLRRTLPRPVLTGAKKILKPIRLHRKVRLTPEQKEEAWQQLEGDTISLIERWGVDPRSKEGPAITQVKFHQGVPRISVVMPVFNGERFLKAAVDSVLAQTLPDFELIVINDGSTDGTAGILDAYADPRLRVLTNETNLGLEKTLNRGLAAARAAFIARLDADDMAEPHRLARQFEVMRERPGLDVLGTWTTEIDEHDQPTGEWSFPPFEGVVTWGMTDTNVIYHPTVIMRRTCLEAVGGYDERMHVTEDYDLFTRILSAGGRIATLPERLVRYRRTAGQISSARSDEQRRRSCEVRRTFLNWLIHERPLDAVLETASALRRTRGEPAIEHLEEAVGLERRIRRRCLRDCDAAGRHYINETCRRMLLHHAGRLREQGLLREARLLWREALQCGPRAATRCSTWKQGLLLAPRILHNKPMTSNSS